MMESHSEIDLSPQESSSQSADSPSSTRSIQNGNHSPFNHPDSSLLSKSFIYESYKYSRNQLRFRGKEKELVADYKCSYYSGTKCLARLRAIVEDVDGISDEDCPPSKKVKVEVVQGHTCNKPICMHIMDSNLLTRCADKIIDVRAEMTQIASERALNEMQKNVKKLAMEIQHDTQIKFKGSIIIIIFAIRN